ncbi:hypothetical protein GCM10010466_56830 [Planomonospora alba]|uniref:HIT domain-containing protein n=1 Tax=Planomonospora alba TaxID=161354 RepID=A0ABP6NUE0_9ACTN
MPSPVVTDTGRAPVEPAAVRPCQDTHDRPTGEGQVCRHTADPPGVDGGEAAGQDVFHFHVHVIPRRHDDACVRRGVLRGRHPANWNRSGKGSPQVVEAFPEIGIGRIRESARL